MSGGIRRQPGCAATSGAIFSPIRAATRLCRRGIETLKIYREERLFARATHLQEEWHDAIHSLRVPATAVVDIRTLGLIAGIEHSPREGAPDARAQEAFVDCFQNGLLIRLGKVGRSGSAMTGINPMKWQTR